MNASIAPSRTVLDDIEAADQPHLGAVSTTHGFVPAQSPPDALPGAFSAWDEAAAALPRLWSNRAVRRELVGLPLLDAGADALADDMLWRASIVLGALAYGFARCDVDDLHAMAPIDIPAPIQRPWAQVAARMGRRSAHLAYDDVVTYNWRLRDPHLDDPFRIANLDQLVPLVGNRAERSFFLVNFEMAAQSRGVVSAVVRAQEAALDRDRETLLEQIVAILDCMYELTEESFTKIDPVRGTPEFADPVIWGKLVAPTGIPIVPDVPGISGAGAPALQLVDSFLGRRTYETHLGRSGKQTRAWYAPNVQRFMDAVEETDVRTIIEQSEDAELRGVFQGLLRSYAGDRGYLGAHRRKVYGFIQTAFKTGRPATASGISGDYEDRAWRETHDFLDEAQQERFVELEELPFRARLARRESAGMSGPGIARIVLDVGNTGLRYRPGDRIAVTPHNGPEIIERTLTALSASGDALIPLPAAWRRELRHRGLPPGERVELRQFLKFAHLRPLDRDLAKTLRDLADPPLLVSVIEARGEDQWELADALEAMAAAGFDNARLWRADLWDREALARIVPPAPPRMYSISTDPGDAVLPDELALTVGHVRYTSAGVTEDEILREGMCSTLMHVGLDPGDEVPVEVVRPQRFTLPQDPAVPVVMFAAGTGIAPFIGFLEQRARSADAGPALLLMGVRSMERSPYTDRLAQWEAEGVVRVERAVSDEPHDGHPPRRIDQLIDDLADELWGHVEGSSRLYVCGMGGFAATIFDALRRVGTKRRGAREATQTLRGLVSERRLMLDVFTTFQPLSELRAGERWVQASELAQRNNDDEGWWMAISGVVYDMTEFRHLHPGGFRIIDDYCGTDGTDEYREIRHHLDSEIEAMLSMYRIGLVQRHSLSGRWGIAITRGQIQYVDLPEFYRHWVNRLYRIAELENSLRNDLSTLSASLTGTDEPEELTPLKFGLFHDTQARFFEQYLGTAIGSEMEELGAVAAGLLDPTADANELRRGLRAVLGAPGRATWPPAADRLRELVDDPSPDPAVLASVIDGLTTANKALLAGLKAALTDGILVFEEYGIDTLGHGDLLLGALRRLPGIVDEYRRQVHDVLGVDPT